MKIEPLNRDKELLELLRTNNLPTSDLEGDTVKPQFFGVRKGRELAGIVGLEIYGETAILRSLAVNRSFRNTGIGRALVSSTEKCAAECGVKDLYLLTENSASYFKLLGFNDVQRETLPGSIRKSTQFADICPASAVVMVKSLPDRPAGT